MVSIKVISSDEKHMCGLSVISVAHLIWVIILQTALFVTFVVILRNPSDYINYWYGLGQFVFGNKPSLLSASFDTERLNHPHLYEESSSTCTGYESSLLTGSGVERCPWQTARRSNPKASVYWLIHSTAQCIYQWVNVFLYSYLTTLIFINLFKFIYYPCIHLFIDNSKLYNDISCRL